jgi:hypothetical protein
MRRILFLALCLLGLMLILPAATADGVVGKWLFVLDTPGGTREAPAELSVDGEKVAGKWAGTTEVKGTYKEGQLELAFPYNSEEAGQNTLKLSGKLEPEGISGKWEFGEYAGTFKATRAKE